MKEVYVVEGLTFEKINKYQTKVSSENHHVILTDLVKKYSHFLNRAKINAAVSMLLGIAACIFTIVIIDRAVTQFSGATEVLLILGGICVMIMSVMIFNSSTWDIKKFRRFIDQYQR